jgi:hypothetical protein
VVVSIARAKLFCCVIVRRCGWENLPKGPLEMKGENDARWLQGLLAYADACWIGSGPSAFLEALLACWIGSGPSAFLEALLA